MDRYTRNVLVVEADPVEQERLSAALEGGGFRVMECSGPTAPDYKCVGARSGRCPLAVDDSVVVLDMDRVGNAGVSGTSARSCSASESPVRWDEPLLGLSGGGRDEPDPETLADAVPTERTQILGREVGRGRIDRDDLWAVDLVGAPLVDDAGGAIGEHVPEPVGA